MGPSFLSSSNDRAWYLFFGSIFADAVSDDDGFAVLAAVEFLCICLLFASGVEKMVGVSLHL